MANFNYLDFFKIPNPNDKNLYIKDKSNNVVWTISTFKISAYFVQNNNIRINFNNTDFAIIDFNNIYESKIALKALKDVIENLNEVVPFNIEKDIKLYIDSLVLGTNGATGSTGSQGNQGDIGPQGNQGDIGPQGNQGDIGIQGNQGDIGPQGNQGNQGDIGPQGNQGDIGLQGNSFTELFATNDAVINTPSSFTLLGGAFSSTNVQTVESFDNSQGFYLQSIIPSIYNDLQGIFLGVYGHSYSYTIEILQTSFITNPYGEYNLCYNGDILNSGTYSDEFRFSLYSDGIDIFYEINGASIASTTYSNDSYYFYSYPENTLLDSYTFSDVLFYPTGKKGLNALGYYATSSTTFAIPDVGYVVNMTTQTYLGYTPGQTILVLNDLIDYYVDIDYYTDGIGPGQFYGIVDSYIPNTGVLTLICVNSQQPGLTYSYWYLNLSGAYPEGGAISTGDISFTHSTITTINNDENIYIQTKGIASFNAIDDQYRTNFEIAGTGPGASNVGNNFIHQGDIIVHNNLVIGGAQYLDPYIQNRSGEYGWTNIVAGTYSIIDSFSTNFRSVKYLVSVDDQDGSGSKSMTCEITLASSYNIAIDPVINVYAIASTTGLQFVTFDTRRNIGDSSIIELIAYTPTSTTCFVTLLRQYVIYPND